jgi:DNA-binding transcriptional ArsR family regulator
LRRLALPELPRGPGRAHAPILFLFLASHLRGSGRTIVWPSNDRIARCTGLSLRAVERGLAYLRGLGKITVTRELRPVTRVIRRRKVGRMIELHLPGDGPNPVVHFPSPQNMAGIWRSCAAVRARPAALVAVAVAEFVLAAAELGDEITEATHVAAPISTVRALVGAPHGSTFNRRLADLEHAGLLARVGEHWRAGAIVKLPSRPTAQPIPTLAPAPMQRIAHPPAANDGPTLEEIVAVNAEVASALRWRSSSAASA